MKTRIPLFVWIILSISLLIIAGSIAYYFVWFLPNKEKATVENKQDQQTNELTQEERETQTRQKCADESIVKAREKLQKLYDAGLMSASERAEWEKAKGVGLTRRDDRDYYFDLCLEINGLK